MEKIKKIFESTLARAISAALFVAFILSIFLFFDFYERKFNEVRGYYLVYKGDKAFKKHDLQKAISYYERGIVLHPRHYKAMYNLANIYVVYEDYYSALKNYEKALKVKPEYEIARIDYAIILSETYKTDQAIEEYKKVIENAPKFYKIPFIVDNKKSYYYNRGVAYYNMGTAYRTKSLLSGLDDTTSRYYMMEASNSFEKALDILKSYNSNYNMGLVNQLLKNKNRAGYFYCKAIEISPLEYEAHFNYAILLNSIKEYTAAAEEFKKAGLLLDSNGDSDKTRYIYNILSEVNQRIAINNDEEYFKKLSKQEDESLGLKYKAGKIIYNDDDEAIEAFTKDFKTCAKRELFMGDEK